MVETAEVEGQKGFPWDSRGKVTAVWIARDLARLKRYMGYAPDPQVLAQIETSKQRVADQIAAYITKLQTRVVQLRTLKSITEIAREYDGIVGTHLVDEITTVAAQRLTRRQPVPWDIRGRVVPAWMKKQANQVRVCHTTLAKTEQRLAAAKSGKEHARLTALVERQRLRVVATEKLLEDMTKHAATAITEQVWHPRQETVKVIEHLSASVEDVKATAALATGSSFSTERYAMLEEKLHKALHGSVKKRGFLREADDALQQGHLGIQHAAVLWSPTHGANAKFATYASTWIGRFMECRTADQVAPDKYLKGAPFKISIDTHEDEEASYIKDPAASDDTVTSAAGRQAVEKLSRLNAQERTAVERVVMMGERREVVATALGISKGTLRKMVESSLAKLRG